jgi:DNA-binding transcriptional ArsR family regulator
MSSMKNGPDIAAVGALVGDPARANILTSLMSGEALTATELAHDAGIAAATASGHLAKLLEGGLLLVEKQGRHRYYRLAGPDVATALEALMDLVEHAGHRRVRPGPKDPEMRKARVCYDHLAGERGVELFARLTRLKLVVLEEGSITMTPDGEQQFRRFGIDIEALKAAKRPVCRTCLDWSERRTHLAGSLGTMLLNRFFEKKWMHRIEGSRVVKFTPGGETAFAKLFE